MKEIKEIVIVEGKTDSQVLKELFIVDTIETHGLALSDATMDIIKQANKTRGIIVLTDPDYPGKKIRNQIQQQIGNCKHAFVEKKDAIGKRKVGIAEARKEAIIHALENIVTFDTTKESIAWSEFLSLNIIGCKETREKVYQAFELGHGNVKTLYKRLNMVGITRKQIKDKVGI